VIYTESLQHMTPKERAESYAKAFPKYPQLRYDDRWLDGFWVLGQDYRGSGFHGAYPPGFLKRVQAIFPHEFRGQVLHLFSGSLPIGVGGIRVDLHQARDPPPDVFADAQRLPFANGVFDLIVADPPYTPADAKKYGTPMINRAAVFRECARVLKPGGHLIWLDTRSPMHRKIDWHWWGVIGISRSTNHLYRAVTFYQRRESFMSTLRTRIKAAAEKIAEGLAVLMGEDAATVAEAMADQKKNTKVRESGDDEEEAAPVKRGRGRPKKVVVETEDDEDEKPKKKLKPPVEDDDDDEDEAPAKKKKVAVADDDDDEDEDAPKIPSDAKLEELDRKALKALAEAHGLDVGGKTREDLTKLLQGKRDKGAPKAEKAKAAAADDDDDDEDEAPKKKKKAAVVDDEAEKPGEDDYPKMKVMKSDLEAFFKLNRQMLKDGGFYGGKPKKGAAPIEHKYDEVMGDPDLIKEAWADNVWPIIQEGKWDEQKAEAEDIEDEDDDE
jgi:SAM-dependent methyltransferase